MTNSVKATELPPFDASAYLDSEEALLNYLRDISAARDPALLAAALKDVAESVQGRLLVKHDAFEPGGKALSLWRHLQTLEAMLDVDAQRGVPHADVKAWAASLTDEDSPELTDEFFARARPASEVLPKLFGDSIANELLKRGPAGFDRTNSQPQHSPLSGISNCEFVQYRQAWSPHAHSPALSRHRPPVACSIRCVIASVICTIAAALKRLTSTGSRPTSTSMA